MRTHLSTQKHVDNFFIKMVLKNEIKQKIKTKTFPQQLLMSKLLQLSEKDIEKTIEEELENNPFLDVDNNVKEKVEKDFATDVFIRKYKKKNIGNGAVEPISRDDLLENLFEQINSLKISSQEKNIARFIVSNLDDRGFLSVDNDFVVNYFFSMRQIKITSDFVEGVIRKIVRALIPFGIASRNVREFFLLQLEKSEGEVPLLAKKIVEDNFIDFTRGNFAKISKEHKIRVKDIRAAYLCLKKLKKYPISGLSSSEESTIAPDFFVFKKESGEFDVKLRFYGLPFLKVENLYKEQMKEVPMNKDFLSFAKERIERAKNFIAAIEKRREILLRAVKIMVDFQKDYFSCGDIRLLRPMTLKNIAILVGVDVSTICRIANSKYIESVWGIIGIKEMFSGFFLKKNGEKISVKRVMDKIRELISKENKKKALSDQKIVNILTKNGVIISRRTVAKYRERLGFAESRIRKTLGVV